MAFDTTLNVDTITLDMAGDIDAAWVNGGMPDDGLRIYGLRRSGNRTMTFLADPGNDNAPRYVLSNGRYLHVSGPTLDEWQEQERLERDARNEYREAAELYEWASGR